MWKYDFSLNGWSTVLITSHEVDVVLAVNFWYNVWGQAFKVYPEQIFRKFPAMAALRDAVAKLERERQRARNRALPRLWAKIQKPLIDFQPAREALAFQLQWLAKLQGTGV